MPLTLLPGSSLSILFRRPRIPYHARKILRMLHIQEDQLCPWAPSMDALLTLTTFNPEMKHPFPLFTLHYIAKGKVGWLDRDTHCYAHLLRVAISPTPALLAVSATLEDLCAYSNAYLPLSALEELTAYLLSWAASCSPFPLLSPDELRSAGSSTSGALHAAETLLCTRAALQDVKEQLLAGFGRSLVTSGEDSPGARLVASIFRRLLEQMPWRLLVILLGRMLPLLHSSSMPGSSILSPIVGEQQGTRRAPRHQAHRITIMHTMAPRVHHSTLYCNAKSAEACGLREFHIEIKPPIKHLGHFHPDTSAPAGSRPDPNTRFPKNTLLLLSASIRSPQPSSPQELYQLAAQVMCCVSSTLQITRWLSYSMRTVGP